jgi:hypothetical protein
MSGLVDGMLTPTGALDRASARLVPIVKKV